MGVRGLFSFTECHRLLKEKNTSCTKIPVVIDGSAVAYDIFQLEQSTFGVCYSHFCKRFQLLLQRMTACRFEILCLVFDGSIIPPSKEETWLKRQEQRIKTVEYIYNEIKRGYLPAPNSDRSSMLRPLMLLVAAITASRDAGYSVLIAKEEADTLLATIALVFKAFVISQDSDFMIFDIPGYIPFSSLFVNGFHQSVHEKDIAKYKLITRKDITNFLGIDFSFAPLWGSMMGNDHVSFNMLITNFYSRDLQNTETRAFYVAKIIKKIPKDISMKQKIEKFVDFAGRSESKTFWCQEILRAVEIYEEIHQLQHKFEPFFKVASPKELSDAYRFQTQIPKLSKKIFKYIADFDDPHGFLASPRLVNEFRCFPVLQDIMRPNPWLYSISIRWYSLNSTSILRDNSWARETNSFEWRKANFISKQKECLLVKCLKLKHSKKLVLAALMHLVAENLCNPIHLLALILSSYLKTSQKLNSIPTINDVHFYSLYETMAYSLSMCFKQEIRCKDLIDGDIFYYVCGKIKTSNTSRASEIVAMLTNTDFWRQNIEPFLQEFFKNDVNNVFRNWRNYHSNELVFDIKNK